MSKILILGGNGRQGVALQKYLQGHDLTQVDLGDNVNEAIHSSDWNLVFSCLPYNLNLKFGDECIRAKKRWADLGGHFQTSQYLNKTAVEVGVTIATDLGLAPGLIEYFVWRRIQKERVPKTLNIYCGGLPCGPIDSFGYTLSFSARGLVNEYVNDCLALVGGDVVSVDSMGDERTVAMNDDLCFVAANTSGVLSENTLYKFKEAGVQNCRYQTLRYPGHWELVRHAWENSGHDFEQFRKWIELIAQKDFPDLIVLAVDFDGFTKGWKGMFYGSIGLGENPMSAMQRGTAAPAAAVAELLAAGEFDEHFSVQPEHIGKSDLFWDALSTRFDINCFMA